jgi:hypothetical protein
VVGALCENKAKTTLHKISNRAQTRQGTSGKLLLWCYLRSPKCADGPHLESHPLETFESSYHRLHHQEQRKIFLDTDERDVMEGEEPSLYHFLRAKARRDARAVHTIQDGTGTIHTTAKDILPPFTVFLRSKYEGNSISKLQIMIEKNRMTIMTYEQHLFFNIISTQI